MKNIGVGPVLVVVCSLLACKLPLKADKETPPTPTPAAAPATPVAPVTPAATAAAAVASEYSTEGLRAIADNCVAPLVILTAIPRSVFDSAGFSWRFASQVAVANPQFAYPIRPMSGPGKIFFRSFEHTPTKGVALVAQCTDTKTCTQFAAAYRTVVPTSKPELVCSKATTLGAEVDAPAVLNYDAPEVLKGSLPAKDNVVGECVRLAACQAERDKKLEGDPAIACQKKPSTFKLACAAKYPCSAVLSCLAQ